MQQGRGLEREGRVGVLAERTRPGAGRRGVKQADITHRADTKVAHQSEQILKI